MRDRVRDLLRGDFLRRGLRDKTMRAVDEAVRPLHDDQARQLGELREEVRRLGEETSLLREELSKVTGEQAQRVLDRVVEFEVRTRRDIVYAADQIATRQSEALVREQMPKVKRFGHPHRTLEHALSLAPAEGMALEFGVWSGATLKIIAGARGGGETYGFDSFEGLPETWRTGFDAGTFDIDGLPEVPGAELVVGWFDEVLPGFLEQHPGPVDFLHVDSDLYSSAKTVLDLVGPRLRPGSIIVFDEYFNFPGWQEHEYLAWREYVERTGTEFSYVGYTYDNEQVIVRIDAT